ncbi:MFS transporter [Streptomyces winkii]|uniref:MFS transporter n=1 Tax=Streptomyces winkii TaxID=3051178 RepID=UPI0028D80A50|nr:MFS transporter [Streptomyces sp. DSM 40971]
MEAEKRSRRTAPGLGAGRPTAARVARVTVVVLFLTWLVDYIDRLVITLALPEIGDEFGLGETGQGLILTAFFITYAAFQIPGGIMADTWGAKRTMLVAAAGWSLFTAACGLARGLASMVVIRAFFGALQGIFPAASIKAISERTTPQQRLTANGAMSASNPFGAAIAPMVAAPLIAAFGWRGAFFAVALLGVAMVFVLWKGLPRALTGTADGEAAASDRAPAGAAKQVPMRDALRLLRSSVMWRFTLMFCGFNIIGWGLVSWVPTFLRESKDVSLAGAGVLAGIPWLGAAVSMVLGGYVFDRYLRGNHRRVVIPVMLVTAVMLGFMVRAETATEFILWETGGTLVMYLAYMQIFGLPLRMLPAEYAGVGGGMVNFGGQLAGAVSPFVMGFLAERFSFEVAFSFLVFGALLAVIGALITPQTTQAFQDGLGRHLRTSPDALVTEQR